MGAPRRTVTAIGFRAHTGWAAAVAVTPQWQVIERRRIAYEPEPTRFIYHHASEVALDAARGLIETARVEAREKAQQEIENLILTLRRKGKTVAAAGIAGGNTRLPDSLPEILAVHSRIHAAEGTFYRDVLADACECIGLRVKRTPEPDLRVVASKTSKSGGDELHNRLAALGKDLGPPWAEDQKLATLAALIALRD